MTAVAVVLDAYRLQGVQAYLLDGIPRIAVDLDAAEEAGLDYPALWAWGRANKAAITAELQRRGWVFPKGGVQ